MRLTQYSLPRLAACAGLLAAVLSFHPTPTYAAETAEFDVYVIGLKAGRITLSIAEDDQRYAASGRIRTDGVVQAISNFRIDAEVTGLRQGPDRKPQRYVERLTSGGDTITKKLTYANATPSFETTESSEGHWLPAAEQTGTLDPMTAVLELLRNRDTAELCKLDATYFDGARKSRLSAKPAGALGDTMSCAGFYERLGGFTRRELRAGTRFPFTLIYERAGQGWKLARMDIQSTRGRAQIIRR
ncbi:DUF3108 domain-containing protein [Roseobacteraceae bacterium S113]